MGAKSKHTKPVAKAAPAAKPSKGPGGPKNGGGRKDSGNGNTTKSHGNKPQAASKPSNGHQGSKPQDGGKNHGTKPQQGNKHQGGGRSATPQQGNKTQGKPFQRKPNDSRDGKKDFAKSDRSQPNGGKHDKKPYAEKREKPAEEIEKPNEKLSAMLKSMKDQSIAWHEAVKALPNEAKDLAKHKATDAIVDEKKRVAERLMEAELKAAESKGSLSSDEKYLKTMIKSGTLADRIAATTLSIQASPVHNLARLSQLVTMAKNKGRREAQMAIDSLKDLFLNNLLPDRKLVFFHQRPIHRADVSQEHLVIWYFEHCVKVAYAQLIAALASGMDDAIEAHKRACIRAVIALLTDKPEQENVLLTMLVNKLGDPDRKVASFVLHQLQELLKVHPVMKRVVVDDVERLLTRAKVTERTKYNAVLFLNQMYLSGTDADLATHLIKVYFGLFSKEVHRDQGKADTGLERKLLSALLVGVNRSFPYAKVTSADFQDEIDTMFRVVHTAHFSTSVQALMLLFQVMNSTNSVPDRFYTALYAKLFDPKLHSTSKHTLFLNLLFRAIKQDVSPARVHAMIKRLLQVSLTMSPAFCCAALFLVSELLQHNKSFRALIDQPEHDLTQDQVVPAKVAATKSDEADSDDEASEDETAAEDKVEEADDADLEAERKRSAALLKSMGLDVAEERVAVKPPSAENPTPYDPRKRNPLYAGAETSCLWELQPFLVHYHPSVAQFAKQLVDGAISYKGDPLNDFTLSVFFDKFVNKKPKSKDGPHRYNGSRGEDDENAVVGVHSDQFLAQDEASVAETDRFFYTFFKERAKRVPAKPAKKAKDDLTGDALASDEDEEYEAFANQLAESIMEDNDDEDPDMDDWSGGDDDDDDGDEGGDDGSDDDEDGPGGAGADLNDEDMMFDDDDDDGQDDDEEDLDDDDDDDDDDGMQFGGDNDDDDDDEPAAAPAKKGKKKGADKRKSPFADADEYLEAIERGEREEAAKQSSSRPAKKRK